MKTVMQWSAVLAMLLISGVATACGVGEQVDGYENTPVAHAHAHWQQGEKSLVPFVFIDVRTAEEYAEGHVRGAKLVPLQELAKRMNEVPKDKQVYVYCRSGRRSAEASAMLARAGFTNIENIQGGIEGWKAAGFPTVR